MTMATETMAMYTLNLSHDRNATVPSVTHSLCAVRDLLLSFAA
jgi:hypothetical protein